MATASLIIDIVIALVCVIIIIKNAARGFIKSFKDGEKTPDGLATFSATIRISGKPTYTKATA